jgi:nitrogen fixation/metabolism regulation signal transduction histidine kinase
MRPIKYFNNDELSGLVKSYNKMVYQIEDQKMLLANKEREEAWREMAKQVAHEVKNPLTPMKLLIQNFEENLIKMTLILIRKLKIWEKFGRSNRFNSYCSKCFFRICKTSAKT